MSDFEKDTSDEDLMFSRLKRIEIINSMTKDGIPKDNREISTLLVALSDMDRASLAKKKLTVDKNNGDMQKQAMELISQMYKNTSLKNASVSMVTHHTQCFLPDTINVEDVVPGETSDIGPVDSYDTFMSRMQA